MAALADFLPDVQPYCEGVPAPLAERAILHALREFCRRSGYWYDDETFEALTDESATGEYTLTLATGTELASVKTPIEHNDLPVPLVTEEWLTTNYSKDWRTLAGEQAKYFVMTAKTVVRLVPYPEVALADAIRVRKILRPALATPTIDDLLLTEWSEQIGYGAQSRLKQDTGKPWADPQGAQTKFAQFEDAIHKAKSMAIAGRQDRTFQRQRRTVGRYF